MTCSMVSNGSLSSLHAIRNSADSLRLGLSSHSLILGAENPSEYPFYIPNSRDVHNYPASPIRDPVEHHFLRSLPHFVVDESLQNTPNFQPKASKKYLHFSAFSEKNVQTFRVLQKELDRERSRSFASLLSATGSRGLGFIGTESHVPALADKFEKIRLFSKFVQEAMTRGGSSAPFAFCDETLLEHLTAPLPAYPMFSSPNRSVCTTHHFPVLASGACGILLCSDAHVAEQGVRPLCQLVDYVFSSKIPSKFEIQVYSFILTFLSRNGRTLDEIDFLEIHENSAVLMSVLHKFIPKHRHKVNVHGGTLATGLVQGAVGAQLILNAATLLQATEKGLALVLVSNEIGDFGIFLLEKTI